MENTIARRKKPREVMCSGITPVAQKQMVTRVRAAVFVSKGDRSSEGKSSIAAAAAMESMAKIFFMIIFRKRRIGRSGSCSVVKMRLAGRTNSVISPNYLV
jgi:hypothetical protein